MWLNLSNDQVQTIIDILELDSLNSESDEKEVLSGLAHDLGVMAKDRQDPGNKNWVKRAISLHQDEGEVEVDQQNDGTALVSEGEDGAYVMAWVFVPHAHPENEEEE